MGAEESVTAVDMDALDAQSPCRIVVIGRRAGDEALLELARLPKRAKIIATGENIEELKLYGEYSFSEANVLFNVTGTAAVLTPIIEEMPLLSWIHSITAGVDHIMCPAISENKSIVLTNAKGIYSAALAEYTMGAIFYFAKDIPRLLKQKEERRWDRYCMEDIGGKTMGIVGYGDIGRACAKLAKAYNMNVIGTRKRPQLSISDNLIDKIYGMEDLSKVVSLSDYLVIATPLTDETYQLINETTFSYSKKNQIVINIGRGPVIDEDALIAALQSGLLKGAALDVFMTEPLPSNSPLWELPNVLISPHNADMTKDFRHKSVRYFCDSCARFINGYDFANKVDKDLGY